MFFRNMEQVNIEVDEITGVVTINQVDESMHKQKITLAIDQIEAVRSWLLEAKNYSVSITNSID